MNTQTLLSHTGLPTLETVSLNPNATGMLRYCSLSLKKQVQLWICHNLGGLVWRPCGRKWKMGPPLRWKMWTPPHVTYPLYLFRFAKCSNAWSTTFTSHVLFLITLFYFRFTRFFLVFSYMQIGELTSAAPVHHWILILPQNTSNKIERT